MDILQDRMSDTSPNISTNSWSRMCCKSRSNAIKVPVRPTPALQTTHIVHVIIWGKVFYECAWIKHMKSITTWKASWWDCIHDCIQVLFEHCLADACVHSCALRTTRSRPLLCSVLSKSMQCRRGNTHKNERKCELQLWRCAWPFLIWWTKPEEYSTCLRQSVICPFNVYITATSPNLVNFDFPM